ncbi:CHRD domain-containing protein [Micromonospora musae]|uniref:CHRD domain-containing protein n=1 Tax=Micromonospora musae TaxID=1894970 RepID=UPI0034182A51
MAASAAVAASAIGTTALADGRDDSGDKRDSHDSRDWSDSRDDKEVNVRAKLSGFEEDPKPISTPGSGRFEAKIDERDKEIRFKLSYEDLKDVQQAHIHFGGRHQSGGVAVFLCSNLKDAKGGHSADVQSCPQAPAKIEGTIKPDDVVGPADQGIQPGEFDELVDAIEAGVTYVNVHTKQFPDGEIRGQIKTDDKNKDDEDRARDKDDDHRGTSWSGDEGRDWNEFRKAWDDHEDKGHEDKGHEDKGHEDKGHEDKGHEDKGHEDKGDKDKGHEDKGHEDKDDKDKDDKDKGQDHDK